jgi:hypothetical protein
MTQDELPRRPRRRLATPVTATLCAVLIAALGFIGGVQVQKAAGDSAPATPARAAGRGGFAGFGGGGGGGAGGGGGGAGVQGGASDATVGSVANVAGKSIYVTDSSGTTVRVKTNKNSKVTRNAVSRVSAVHPGDTVIVQGTKASSGTVTATSIAATAKNATGGGGVAGLLGGGQQPAGG